MNCERCGQPLTGRSVSLELNNRTGEWRLADDGSDDLGLDSQGCFAFGQDCARRILRGQDPEWPVVSDLAPMDEDEPFDPVEAREASDALRERLAAPPDFRVTSHGTIHLFDLLTATAREWVAENVNEHTLFGGALVVEHRYSHDLAQGMRQAGLKQEVPE